MFHNFGFITNSFNKEIKTALDTFTENTSFMESKIHVSLRVKPLTDQEKMSDRNHGWSQVSDTSIRNQRTQEVYQFDRVFAGDSTTREIFDSSVKDIVHAAMDGINQTVFAYGQTSSGKTHTMKGYSPQERGLIPLSVQEIFSHAESVPGRTFEISCSYIEIYNESVNDLIEPTNKNLDVRESIANGIYINRLTETKVNGFDQVMQLMAKGDEFRSIAATKLNELSSRSHTVFRINICSKDANSDEQDGKSGKMKVSQLNLVDLAGSEGASKTQAEGIRLREGQNINRSLLALSNVINKLS